MTEEERDWARICHGGTSLSAEDARKLEEALRVTPEDVETRVKLVGHYFLVHDELARARRAELLVWLAGHRPDIALGGYGTMVAEQVPEAYAQARALWVEAAERHGADLKILKAAGGFLSFNEPDLAEEIYRRAAVVQPDEVEWRERIAQTFVSRAHRATERSEICRFGGQAVDAFDEALKLAQEDWMVLAILIDIARAAVQAERWDRAVDVAERVLLENETCRRTFLYGNAIHWANIALGHAALARGEVPVGRVGVPPGSISAHGYTVT